MCFNPTKIGNNKAMFKLLLILPIFLMVSCSKKYLEPPTKAVSNVPAVTLTQQYTSVDYARLSFKFSSEVNMVNIIRSEIELPRSLYDGKNHFGGFHPGQHSFLDESNLMVDKNYYYTFFYTRFDEENVNKPGISVKIKTLNYQDGMHQLLLELIEYAKSKSNALEFAVGTTHLDVFYDQFDNGEKALKGELMNEIDAVFLFEYQFSKNQHAQMDNIKNANDWMLDELKSEKKIFAIDYLTLTSPLINEVSPVDGVVHFIDPVEESKLFDVEVLNNIPNNDPELSVNVISEVQNFALYDGSYALDEPEILTIQGSSYDLIVLPVSKNSYTSELSPWSLQKITSLKEKSNGINRLVYAMIDVSKVWENGPFWNMDWNSNPELEPDWVDIGVSKTIADNSRIEGHDKDHYVKYWRKDWKSNMKQLIDNVVNSGFDGIVFSGAETYKDYDCKDENGPKICQQP